MAKRSGMSLDNGVIPNKPSLGGNPEVKQGRSFNFYNAIAKGENPHGQTSIVPGDVIRAGVCGYDRPYKWSGDTDGSRWNGDPFPKGKKDDPYK